MADERRVIDTVTRSLGKPHAGYSEIGDDVALIPSGGDKVVLKVDMLVEGTDVPPGMSYRQAARKAVAMCVSDFAAKGVRPEAYMVSLGLRKGTSQEEVDQLARGFRDAEGEWGVRLVGGDTNEAVQLIVDCVMVGFAKKVVGRSGARPGDVLVVTGPFGYPPSGLKILTDGANARRSLSSKMTRSVTMPTPDLEVGLSLAPHFTSSMDSSDGLARSLHTLAGESGVGFEVDSLPVAEGVAEFANKNGLSLQELVMEGGEEYVIVGTVKAEKLAAARNSAKSAGGQLIEIGRATADKGMVFLKKGRSRKRIEDEGWTHLG